MDYPENRSIKTRCKKNQYIAIYKITEGVSEIKWNYLRGLISIKLVSILNNIDIFVLKKS